MTKENVQPDGEKVKPVSRGFRDYWKAGYGTELVGVIPIDAEITQGSAVTPEHRGKVPGVKTAAGTWSGKGGKFHDEDTTLEELKQAYADGAGVGIKGRKFPGLDIDISDKRLADGVSDLANFHFGFGPVRERLNSPRRLHMLRGERQRKRRLAFFRPGHPKVKGEKPDAVELLGYGQYYNLEGLHPSGVAYQWRGEHPCDVGHEAPPEANDAAVDHFYMEARAFLESEGCRIVGDTSDGAGLTTGTRKSLDDPSLHAPSPQRVVDVLKKWQPDDMAHDEFVQATAAIKASLGADREQYYADYLEWAPGVRSTEDHETRKRWDSVHDAQVGWDWLCAKAGSDIGAQADFDDGASEEDCPTLPDPEQAATNAMLGEYVWVEGLACYVRENTGAMVGSREFAAANVSVAPFGATGRQSAEAIFQNHPRARKVATVTCLPGKPVTTTDENERGIKVPVVNLWRPSGLQPRADATDEDVKPWLELVTLLFGPAGAPEREHFLNFAACLVQCPGKKIGHALVIVGGQGTGKDSLLRPVFEAVGMHNVASIDTSVLDGQWTYFLKSPVIYVQEIISNNRRDRYDKLKPFISAQATRLPVNEKNVRQWFVPNHQNWIFSSNHDNALRLESDDRRVWVHRVLADKPLPDDMSLPYHEWCKTGGSEAVFGWLLQRDISGFNAMARPPMTAAKRTMLDQSQPENVRWLRDLFREGGLFASRTVLTVRDLMDAANQSWSGLAQGIKPRHVTDVLKLEGFETARELSIRVRANEEARSLWVRDPSRLLGQLPPAAIRDRYLAEEAAAKSKAKAEVTA